VQLHPLPNSFEPGAQAGMRPISSPSLPSVGISGIVADGWMAIFLSWRLSLRGKVIKPI
jgi:hypothetical protein